MNFRNYLFSYIYLSIFLLSVFTNWYAPLIITLIIFQLLVLLYKIGSGIVLMETMILLYVFTCLLMPLFGFHFYNYDDQMTRLWVRYMPIPETVYFNYTLPAITAFCFAVTLPSIKGSSDSGEAIKNKISLIGKILDKNKKAGLRIIIVGAMTSVIVKFLPDSFSYFASLVFFSSFAGLLYVFFTPALKYRKPIMFFFCLFIMVNAIQGGMFTIVIYMGITIFSFFQVGKRITMLKKVLLVLLGLGFTIVLQNVKGIYRLKTWNASYSGNKIELFTSLFAEKIQAGTGLFEKDAMFPLYSRTNQGYNVAIVMRRIPRIQSYDNGGRLFTVLASAFVPRFLWTDKPEAGGKFNMKYYAGIAIVNWSTNVGPVGEAYGSFGAVGGIVYMCVLGFFIRWTYLKFFSLSAKVPLLVCWLPVLFYQVVYSAEADTQQIVNPIFKAAFFIWIFYKIVPSIFGVYTSQSVKMRSPLTSIPVRK